MGLLVRKINRSKWPNSDNTDVFEISSDAITSCLRSTRNTLSVWKIDSEKDLDEAVLALAASFQRLESIDVVLLEGQDLVKANINCIQTKGITLVKDLEQTHYDLSELNYFKVGLVAEHIAQRIYLKKIKRYTVTDLKRVLNKAIEDNRLKMEDLNESVRKKIA
tara:strand:- start:134 stop:625 length:492 start_codon:yes stop_codon:yes gene_type:complete